MRKLLTKSLTVLLSAALLMGCSSTESGTNTSEALTVAAVQEKGTLIVGGEMNYPPYEYYDDNENIIGYDIDIWNIIAEDLGVELEIIDIPFSGVLTGLDAGQYDVGGCAIGVSAERAQSYLFSIPMFATSYTVSKMADNDDIQSVDDLSGKTIGCQTGSSPEQFATAYNEQLIAEGKEGITIKTYSGPHDAFLDMQNGGVDAVIESGELTNEFCTEESGMVIIGEMPNSRVYVSFAFRQTDTELCDYVSDKIRELKEDGTLYELQEQWFGYTIEDLPEEDFIPAE